MPSHGYFTVAGMPDSESPAAMTKREACAYLDISPRTLAERVKEGKLPCHYIVGKNGKEARFHTADVERLKRDMETPVTRTDIALAEEPLPDLGPLLFDAAGKPEPVGRILALAETLRIGETIGIPRRDVLAWHRAALQSPPETPSLTPEEAAMRFAEALTVAVAAAIRPPSPALVPHMTLTEAAEYSGLPAAYLVAGARAGTIRAVNVGTAKREFWRFPKT